MGQWTTRRTLRTTAPRLPRWLAGAQSVQRLAPDGAREATGIVRVGDFVWMATHGGALSVVDQRTDELVFHERFVPDGATLGEGQLAIGFTSI